MNIFNRANQGGVTVLGFIIVGVILAIVTVGAVYALYQRGEQARRDRAIAVVEEQENAGGEMTPAETPSDDQPTTNPAPVPTVAESKPAPTELPATGPTDNLMAVFVLAILTASITSYGMSRRALRVTL